MNINAYPAPAVASWSHQAQSDVQAQYALLTLPHLNKHVIKGCCISVFSQNLTSSLSQSTVISLVLQHLRCC